MTSAVDAPLKPIKTTHYCHIILGCDFMDVCVVCMCLYVLYVFVCLICAQCVYVCVMNALVSCPRRVLSAGARFHGSIREAVSPVAGSCPEAAVGSRAFVPAADTELRSGRSPGALRAPLPLALPAPRRWLALPAGGDSRRLARPQWRHLCLVTPRPRRLVVRCPRSRWQTTCEARKQITKEDAARGFVASQSGSTAGGTCRALRHDCR